VGNRNDKEGIGARTSGAVLRLTVRIQERVRHSVTHISAMFGGMGGKDDIMGSRCGYRARGMDELPSLRRRDYQAEIDSRQSDDIYQRRGRR
jgi:hypothetical protein